MRHRRLTGTIAFCAAVAVIGVTATLPVPVPEPAARADEPERPGLVSRFGSGGSIRPDQPVTGAAPAYSAERDSLTESGILGPRTRITVANLTVRPGQYIVSYSFEARLQASGEPEALVCGVIDSNGRPRFLIQDEDPIYAGSGWERRSFAASFSLPSMTLGLRCVAVGTGLSVASFRDISLAVTRMEASG